MKKTKIPKTKATCEAFSYDVLTGRRIFYPFGPIKKRKHTVATRRIPGTWYQVLVVPGTCYQVLVKRCLVPVTRHLVPGTWCQAPGARQLAPRAWYQLPGA